jgi:hypothetical protein
MTFKIDDVVFIALEKKMQILPARVLKKITQESAEGVEVLLTLQFPDSPETKTLPATKNIFVSVEDARDKLLQRAIDSIDVMCKNAQKIADVSFSRANQPEAVVQSHEEDDDTTYIELPGGTLARVKNISGI